MALSLYKHNQYGTLSYEQVDSNWSQIESDVNGLSSRLPLNNYAATTDPTVNNDVTQGYSNGSLWYNRTTDTAFVLTNASSGAANWVERDSISAADLGSAAFADILGTVSQSGGVPTGAVIESGSNDDGIYWKYAGGMMVSSIGPMQIPLSGTSLDAQVDYPAAYNVASSDVSVQAIGARPTALWDSAFDRRGVKISTQGSSPIVARVLIERYDGSGFAGTFGSFIVLAIGRWY